MKEMGNAGNHSDIDSNVIQQAKKQGKCDTIKALIEHRLLVVREGTRAQ